MGAASDVVVRWRFIDGASEIEQAGRAKVEHLMDRFWAAFAESAAELQAFLAGRAEFDLPRFMVDHLEPIDPRLGWDIAAVARDHRLVITAESARHLSPLVGRMMELAPSLSNWTFLRHRPPEGMEEARSLVEQRTGDRLRLDRVGVSIGTHGLIDLTFLPERGIRPNRGLDEQAVVAASVLAGEEYFESWLGTIDVASSFDEAFPVDQLHHAVTQAIREAQITLPDRPYFRLREELTWSVYQLGETDRDDEEAARHDVYVGRTALPDLFATAHGGAPFSSSRFSRTGELFCYVKLDGMESEPPSALRDRVTLEERLDQALTQAEMGNVIGGATGRAYSYIDLALAQPELGLSKAQELMRELGAPRRSWILFFDDELAAEWIPIWDDSPRPPGLPT